MTSNNSRLDILCIPYTHTLSHVSRPLLIAKELRERGHDIVFAGEGSQIELIGKEGFNVLPLYEPDPAVLYGNIRKGKLRFANNDEVEKMLQADLSLFKEVKPDLVLTDGRFTAPISTHIAGLRHIAIVNVSSTEFRAHPYIPFFEWIPHWIINRNSGLWHLFDSLNLKLEMSVFDKVMNIFTTLSDKYNIKKSISATNCLTGKDITLLADIPEYFPAKKLPADYHYIGPLTWQSNIPPPLWWPPKKEDNPVIYITMGTTGIEDFFHKIYDLFITQDLTAIMSTGAQIKGLKTIEEKFYIESFIDGDLVMDACALVVCHGGNGTIYQALRHGKPIIGIPTIPDQKFNMRRVEALGAGKTLPWRNFLKNPASLLELIQSVLKEKSYYQSASRLEDILKPYNAAETAADIIEKSAPNM
jgi:UDP:flavonoid glycosyltransferase YjiC (YdhE family)